MFDSLRPIATSAPPNGFLKSWHMKTSWPAPTVKSVILTITVFGSFAGRAPPLAPPPGSPLDAAPDAEPFAPPDEVDPPEPLDVLDVLEGLVPAPPLLPVAPGLPV